MEEIIQDEGIGKSSISGMRWYYHKAASDIKKTYRASVTTILGKVMPKGPAFDKWQKNTGWFADIIRDTAGTMGTVVHQLIEDYLRGFEINRERMIETILRQPNKVWMTQMDIDEFIYKVRRYMESYSSFYDEYLPVVIGNEIPLWHPQIGWAGQTDQLYIMKSSRGKDIICLVDNKTGTQKDDHFIQQAAYAILLKNIYNITVDKIGVLYIRENYRTNPTHTLKLKPFSLISEEDLGMEFNTPYAIHKEKKYCYEWYGYYNSFRRKTDCGEDGFPRPTHKPQPREVFTLRDEFILNQTKQKEKQQWNPHSKT